MSKVVQRIRRSGRFSIIWRIGLGLWWAVACGWVAAAQDSAVSSFGDGISDWWERTRNEVLDYFERFDDYLSRTRLLTVGELQSLPVGLQTKVGQTVCDLLVTEAVFGPDYADLTV
ncbi:MAG: hypothetical protein K2O01_02490, partial [Bacteroidales bacterium]|nr:hypothetical protein [Bacteroidales bacterium]